MVFLKEFFKNVYLENFQQTTKTCGHHEIVVHFSFFVTMVTSLQSVADPGVVQGVR